MAQREERYPERNAAIIKLARGGMGPRAIARKMKAEGAAVNVNIVVGVLHRAGITRESGSVEHRTRQVAISARKVVTGTHKSGASPHRAPRALGPSNRIIEAQQGEGYTAPSLPLPASEKDAPPQGAVPFEQRTGCAWPFGDNRQAPLLFCNAPRWARRQRDGRIVYSAYCQHHHQRGRTSVSGKPIVVPAGL